MKNSFGEGVIKIDENSSMLKKMNEYTGNGNNDFEIIVFSFSSVLLIENKLFKAKIIALSLQNSSICRNNTHERAQRTGKNGSVLAF